MDARSSLEDALKSIGCAIAFIVIAPFFATLCAALFETVWFAISDRGRTSSNVRIDVFGSLMAGLVVPPLFVYFAFHLFWKAVVAVALYWLVRRRLPLRLSPFEVAAVGAVAAFTLVGPVAVEAGRHIKSPEIAPHLLDTSIVAALATATTTFVWCRWVDRNCIDD